MPWCFRFIITTYCVRHHRIHSNLIVNSQSSFTMLSASDVMTHLNITDSGQTAYCTRLLNDAVTWAENRSQLDLRTCTYTLQLDRFPSYYTYDDEWSNYLAHPGTVGRESQERQQIQLLRGPLVTLTSITYYDTTNVQQTVDNTTYTVGKPSLYPGIVEPFIQWPTAYSRIDAVSVNYTTGITSSTLVSGVCRALLLKCGEWYSNRENISYGAQTAAGAAGQAADDLLDQVLVVAVA